MWLLWIGLNHGQNLYLIHKIGAIYKFLSLLCIFKVIDWRQIGRILATFATRQKYIRKRREATQCRARNCSTLQRVTHLTLCTVGKQNYGQSLINLLYTEPAKMQKALLSNKARWSRNRAHPFQAVSHSKGARWMWVTPSKGARWMGLFAIYAPSAKRIVARMIVNPAFQSLRLSVRFRLGVYWKVDYLNESWTTVHLLGLKIFLPPQLSNASF